MTTAITYPFPFRSITACLYQMTRGIPDPASATTVSLMVKPDPNGIRDHELSLMVAVSSGYWACRHAGIEHPLDAPLFLISDADLHQQHLMPMSPLFQQTVGSSRYAVIDTQRPDGRPHQRIVRSRHGHFGADNNGTQVADARYPIGFLQLSPAAAKIMLTLGGQVNIGLRQVTALKL